MLVALILKSLIVILTLIHSIWLVFCAHQSKQILSLVSKIKLAFGSIIAFLADTLGIGSFAINIAFAKAFKLLPTAKLPGFVNSAQVLPGTIQAFIFMSMIDVDLLTLVTLAVSACLGGILGALFVSKINATFLKKIMIICFSGMILLLIATEAGLIHISGDAIALSGYQLIITAFFMGIAGALTAVCVGLYATSQAILFIAGISPLAAFPIMMAAGALQQPLLAMTFLAKDYVPTKETAIVTLFGLIGIAIGLPLITSVSVHVLHCLLMIVLIYNIASLYRSLKTERAEESIEHVQTSVDR